MSKKIKETRRKQEKSKRNRLKGKTSPTDWQIDKKKTARMRQTKKEERRNEWARGIGAMEPAKGRQLLNECMKGRICFRITRGVLCPMATHLLASISLSSIKSCNCVFA